MPPLSLEKLTLANEQYRQINHLVILIVKALLSRKFCQKRVRVNFRNFHTTVHYAFRISLHSILWQNEKIGLTEKTS